MNDDRGMNDSQIERVFGSLARIEQKIDGTTEWMKSHSQEDKRAFESMGDKLTGLQVAHSRQKGFLSALAAIGSVVAGIVGYVIEYFVSGRGHH